MNAHNDHWEAAGETNYVSDNAFDDVNKPATWPFRAWASAAVLYYDNDMLDLLRHITETFPCGNGGTDNSHFPGQMSYSGATLSFFPSCSLTSFTSPKK